MGGKERQKSRLRDRDREVRWQERQTRRWVTSLETETVGIIMKKLVTDWGNRGMEGRGETIRGVSRDRVAHQCFH